MKTKRSENTTYSMVAAQPGWSVGSLDCNGAMWLDPIIAWEVERYVRPSDQYVCRYLHPITLTGITNGDIDGLNGDLWVIRRPDGTYDAPEVMHGVTEAKAIEYLKEEAASQSLPCTRPPSQQTTPASSATA